MQFLIAILILFTGPKLFAQTYHLHIGESLRLSLPGKIRISDKNAIAIRDLGSQVELTGKKKGTATLIATNKLVTIHTLSAQQSKTFSLLKTLVPATLGLKTALRNGKVILTGEVHRFDDWKRIADACASIPCDFEAEFSLQQEQERELEQKLKETIAESNLPYYEPTWAKPVSISSSKNDSKNSNLVQTYRNFGIRVQKSDTAVDLAPLIRVQITVVEMKRNHTQNLGLSWPGQLKAHLLPQFIWNNESTEAALNLLEQQGVSKTLANPSLLCRSGKSAEFIAGGEIPIKIMNYKMQDIIWKRYGIVLKIKPKADYQGRMSIELETEVSSLDGANKVDGIPGVFTNRIQSHFDLHKSKTIVLSGLIKSEDSESTSGLPGLSRLPILGKLFGSEDFRNNKTELLVFVTPEVIDDSAE